MKSTVAPKYPATKRVKKLIEIEQDEERSVTVTGTIEVVPDNISINTEEQLALRQVNLRKAKQVK